MKKIKLLLLVTLLGLTGIAHAATINISGLIYNNGVPKSGTTVIFTDSASMNSDTAISNSSGIYNIVLKTNSLSGQADGYIVDCNRTTKYKTVYYRSSSTQYGGVNFTYCASGTSGRLSTVSGLVFTKDTSIIANKGIVVLIEKSRGKLTAVDTAILNRGYYFFTLPDSNKTYLVKAILDTADSLYKSVLPTYADSALNWANANVLPPAQGLFYRRLIYMKRGTNKGGPGFIGGLVSRGANKNNAVGDPIKGAQVMLMDNNVPVAYVYSDASGKFSFSNLAYGTYTVYTEVMGLPTVTADVTLSAAKQKEEGVMVSINSSGVTTSINATSIETNGVFASLKAFPNPVQGNLTILFGIKITDATISTIDLTGKVIASQEVSNSTEVNLSFEGLAKGSYIVRISSQESTSVIRVVKH